MIMLLTPSILRNDFSDNFFDDFFNDRFWRPVAGATKYNAMNTDIKEGEHGYEIGMELPGFSKEDVTVALKDGYLTVTATHSDNKEEGDENKKYIRRERYSGHYQRSFYIGDEITQEDIKASFKDGILTLDVPKKEAKQPEVEEAKYIQIEG